MPNITDTKFLHFWLTLLYAKITSKTAFALFAQNIQSLEQLLALAPMKLTALGIKDKHIDLINNNEFIHKQIAQNEQWLASNELHYIIYLGHPSFPQTLASLVNAPYLLYVKGNVAILQAKQIAVVGSRNPTPTGKQDAFAFASHLAKMNITITSGMASGIDTYAHQGALTTGQTIAVLGTGIDNIYPKANANLYQQIAEKGALISEFALGVGPISYNFPRRNRIISGLSLGTLVVEASLKSGSLITARLAVEQNKEVFAIPGSIHSVMSKGCHYLIQQGAKLVENADDIISEIANVLYEQDEQPAPVDLVSIPTKTTKTNKTDLTPEQQKVAEQLDYNFVSIDIIVQRTGMPVNAIMAILLQLELSKVVVNDSGTYALFGS